MTDIENCVRAHCACVFLIEPLRLNAYRTFLTSFYELTSLHLCHRNISFLWYILRIWYDTSHSSLSLLLWSYARLVYTVSAVLPLLEDWEDSSILVMYLHALFLRLQFTLICWFKSAIFFFKPSTDLFSWHKYKK